MTRVAFIFMLLFLAIYAEVMSGSFGMIIPLTVLAVFYVSVTYGWHVGMAVGGTAGIIIDSLYGRSPCFSAFTMAGVAGLAMFWLYKGDVRHLRFQVIPGLVIPVIYILPPLAQNFLSLGPGVFAFVDDATMLVAAGLVGCIILPVMVLALDAFNSLFKLEEYMKAKDRLAKE